MSEPTKSDREKERAKDGLEQVNRFELWFSDVMHSPPEEQVEHCDCEVRKAESMTPPGKDEPVSFVPQIKFTKETYSRELEVKICYSCKKVMDSRVI